MLTDPKRVGFVRFLFAFHRCFSGRLLLGSFFPLPGVRSASVSLEAGLFLLSHTQFLIFCDWGTSCLNLYTK